MEHTMMFILGLLVGLVIGYVLACVACGKLVPIWEALNPVKRHNRINGGGVSG